MLETPPPELVATLERIGLALPSETGSVARRVRRLAKDLPQFDSVWIDALAQARVLTPFQAAEYNAGRAESLRIGPFVLCEPLAHPYYAACYRARRVDSGDFVRAAVIENAGRKANDILRGLRSLVEQFQKCRMQEHPEKTPTAIAYAGQDGDRLYAAEPWTPGRSAAEWIVRHGRFPPNIVLQIARAMLVELVELEKIGVCHGDVGTASLLLSDMGDVALALPGLRGILRPEEGFARADLLPEAFDGLAPERIALGTPPNAASDMYACGYTWWQLLCGRPPLTGGNALAKLRAAQAGGISDVRRIVPETPPLLADAISACVEIDPARRPASFAHLAAALGHPTRGGREALSEWLVRSGRPTVRWNTTVRSVRGSNKTPFWLAGAACCAAAVVALLWPGLQNDSRRSTPGSARQARAASVAEKSSARLGKPMVSGSARHEESTLAVDESSARQAEPADSAVVPAAYRAIASVPRDLVLPSERAVDAGTLVPQAGQCIRAAAGRRAVLLVPASGWAIAAEDVRFENIDFACMKSAEKPVGGSFVHLRANRAAFRGCTFRGARESGYNAEADAAISAIRWSRASDSDDGAALARRQLHLADCMFSGLAAAVDCEAGVATDIEIVNTLHVFGGPLLRCDRPPAPETPLTLVLSQATLRESGPLLECRVGAESHPPGEIAVVSTACVFMPRPGEPLVRCTGAASLGSCPFALRWSGQGSLIAPDSAVFALADTQGREQPIDESSLSIAGLVRGEVGFAGPASSDPAASRALRWQAPLRSASPPGIGEMPAFCGAGCGPLP